MRFINHLYKYGPRRRSLRSYYRVIVSVCTHAMLNCSAISNEVCEEIIGEDSWDVILGAEGFVYKVVCFSEKCYGIWLLR